MRIAVIGPTYPYKGGISHFTTTLVQRLRKKNQVDFISWKRQYPSFLYPVELKDTKSKHPIQTEAKFILDFFNPLSWLWTFLEIRNKKAELLILQWVSPIQGPIYFVICILTKTFTKTKVLYVCHNVEPHEKHFYDSLFISLAFMYGDTYIVHSRADKLILEELTKNKNIIEGFLPTFDMFRSDTVNITRVKRNLNLGSKVILFFGYIRPYKGLKYLLDAMPQILNKYRDLMLLVVGEFWSKDKKDYTDQVDKLGIIENVIFIDNYVPNEDLGRYFAVSDVVVLPYTSATQSASIQTAYAFNKPVISTAVGGLSDVVEDGKTGYVIDPENADDIAKKVLFFYKKPINENSIQKYKARFSWDNYIRIIQNIVH